MSMQAPKHPALQLLPPDETVDVVADAAEASLIVTDRRLAVAQNGRLALDVPFEGVRRIQFDIERRRPATLVIVPEHPVAEPQVSTIPPQRYGEVARAITLVGERIYELE